MHYIGQSLTALDHTSCKLSWTPSASLDLDGYYVYMSEGDDSSYERMTGDPLTDPEWVSPPLRLDRTYYFYITSVDLSGNESAPSNVYPFTLPDAAVDATVVVVEPVPALTVDSGAESTEPVSSSNFMTSFTLGE